ncbi:MAG: endo alpha-1,4 polygalactosaminidase [Thermodesulfobacteria bacterium]|nr:endo alpha-1,4 polygalactosaminidase [Thermodesulfobacteriota bacterium]
MNDNAGIDVSPAVRDYLALEDIDKVNWQFVDFDAVEPGPWLFHVNVTGQDWYRPLAGATFYWQLQGDIVEPTGADIYDIDLFDTQKAIIDRLKAQGKRVICYFSAGSAESWRPDYSLFSQGELGLSLQGWQGEQWLDIRSQNVRAIMAKRLDLAVEKGCDGVEPDNIDGFSNNTGFPLTYEDQLSYNKFLAREAHKRGLAIGLKNDLEQARDLVGYFDFLLMESCFDYEECDLAWPFVESLKPVFDVEYGLEGEALAEERRRYCEEASTLGIEVMFANWDLDGSYWESCQ